MSYKPPFTNTSDILNLVADIGQQLGEAIAKDIRTIGRALVKLQQAGEIKRVGSNKTGHWEVQP